MESAMSFLQFFSGKEFSVPLWEVGFLVVVNSLCLLLGKHKLGLIVSYFFVFYWGFIINRGYFVDVLGNMTVGLYIYGICGIAMAVVVIVGLFVRSDHR